MVSSSGCAAAPAAAAAAARVRARLRGVMGSSALAVDDASRPLVRLDITSGWLPSGRPPRAPSSDPSRAPAEAVPSPGCEEAPRERVETICLARRGRRGPWVRVRGVRRRTARAPLAAVPRPRPPNPAVAARSARSGRASRDPCHGRPSFRVV
jgi:hypothetical protein